MVDFLVDFFTKFLDFCIKSQEKKREVITLEITVSLENSGFRGIQREFEGAFKKSEITVRLPPPPLGSFLDINIGEAIFVFMNFSEVRWADRD